MNLPRYKVGDRILYKNANGHLEEVGIGRVCSKDNANTYEYTAINADRLIIVIKENEVIAFVDKYNNWQESI